MFGRASVRVGYIHPFLPTAFNILDHPNGLPMVAGARLGLGHVVLENNQDTFAQKDGPDNLAYLRQAIEWGLQLPPGQGIHVRTLAFRVNALTRTYFTNATYVNTVGDLRAALPGVRAVVANMRAATPDDLDALFTFVATGGFALLHDLGIGYPWSWYSESRLVEEARSQYITRPAGLVLTDRYPRAPTQNFVLGEHTFAASNETDPHYFLPVSCPLAAHLVLLSPTSVLCVHQDVATAIALADASNYTAEAVLGIRSVWLRLRGAAPEWYFRLQVRTPVCQSLSCVTLSLLGPVARCWRVGPRCCPWRPSLTHSSPCSLASPPHRF